jgi:phosphodiesterase/alkaline phosphatase D-like protein
MVWHDFGCCFTSCSSFVCGGGGYETKTQRVEEKRSDMIVESGTVLYTYTLQFNDSRIYTISIKNQ